VLDPGGHRTTYLPDDIWYDFATGKRVAGGQEFDQTVPFDAVPLYVRGGSILTLGPVVQHTRDSFAGPLDVQVYPGRDGQFTLVEDDGSTSAYQAGNLRKTTFIWNDAQRKLSWTQTGSYDGSDRYQSVRITIHDEAAKAPIERPLSASGDVALLQ
jgi:alpha-D-xyloside xylohydrolase